MEINTTICYVDRMGAIPYVTPYEVAVDIGVHPETIRRWLKEGRIKGTKYGRQWRIPFEEYVRIVEGGLDEQCNNEGGEPVAAAHP